jgi:hypothetical protein
MPSPTTPKLAISATAIASDPKLPKTTMTRSEAAEGGAAPETKGDAVGATAAAGIHSNLGAVGGANPAVSAERVNFKVSPSWYNVFLVVDLSRD